ncbi:DNA polymerase epsilon subunit 4-like isoform X2 [Centruroides sculpturatus]|uniref:DNA polymerase epsilon subunit 4-like isoform X2 n=1 Tax=Centruroides sculpturatus TaxID=218467 RepID=UPI000C6CE178|nr:DNA polymerase epsilon subunit 4-like isoform X2 [Centruroides sculpturatus]
MAANLEDSGDGAEIDERTDDKPDKLTRIPLSRVKTLMKLDPDVTLASQEAVLLVAKATVGTFCAVISKRSIYFHSASKEKNITEERHRIFSWCN